MSTLRSPKLVRFLALLATVFAAGAARAEYPEVLTTLERDTALTRGFEQTLSGGDPLVAEADSAVAQASSSEMRQAPGTTAHYVVSRVLLEYAEEHPEQPDLQPLYDLELLLSASPRGLSQPRPGVPIVEIAIRDFGLADTRVLEPSAIRSINARIVDEFNAMGYAGVLVEPHPEDIDPRTGRDLRPPARTELRLVIWTGHISRLRTFASGERVSMDERVNNPAHERIKDRSPLQPVGSGPGSLMRLNLIEDYVARLNRHPGRRVDVALSPAQEPGGVYLDYLVAENKPWATYAQVSDTGTKSTGHSRQRFGFMHTQFTGRDDILQVDYYTGDFDEVSAWFGSYEAPFFGSDLTRWRLTGSIAEYDSEDLGITLQDFDGDTRSAGLEFFRNIFQDGRLFLDLTFGARWEYYRQDNKQAQLTPHDNFFLPGIGLRLERRSDTSNLFGSLRFEGNVSGIAGTDADDFEAAGGLRTQVDEDWSVLKWDTSASAYLEPLLNRPAWEDLSTPASSTLAHEVAARFFGQYAFDKRLIPGAMRAVGGLYSVRGYKQSLVAGDSVFLGSLEYRFHLPRVCNIGPPVDLPVFGSFRLVPEQPGGRPDWDLIFKLFVDAGRVITSDRVLGPSGVRFEDNYTLLGAGGGVELQLRRNLTARFDLGFALEDVRELRPGLPKRKLADAGDAEAHFSITTLY